jgi:hypothetical protein
MNDVYEQAVAVCEALLTLGTTVREAVPALGEQAGTTIEHAIGFISECIERETRSRRVIALQENLLNHRHEQIDEMREERDHAMARVEVIAATLQVAAEPASTFFDRLLAAARGEGGGVKLVHSKKEV